MAEAAGGTLLIEELPDGARASIRLALAPPTMANRRQHQRFGVSGVAVCGDHVGPERPSLLVSGVFLALAAGIVLNALYLQPGRHPAPLFLHARGRASRAGAR